MQEQDIRDEINMIKAMVEKSRRSTAEFGGLFVFWGVLIIVAEGASILLETLGRYRQIWLLWAAAVVIGWGISFIYWFRRARSGRVETYAGTAARDLGIACGVGFLLACFVFPLLKVYSSETIPMAFGLIAGIFFFVLGGLYDWTLMKGIGLAWWLGSVGLVLIGEKIRNLAYLGLFIVLYFIPSLIIWRKHRSEQREK